MSNARRRDRAAGLHRDALGLEAAGLTVWRRVLLGNSSFGLFDGNWAAVWPALLWPIWGLALGAATLAYYYRRKGGTSRPD
jgi:hypothetical protein